MSEPVGSSPRRPLEGTNSLKARAASIAEGPKPEEDRPKVDKIVSGSVVQRKPSLFRRAARSMVADDVTNVGDFVVVEVLLPAVRNLVYDVISQGSHRILYGTARGARRGVGFIGANPGPVTSLKTAYNKATAEPDRGISREAAARHDFDELILDSHADAIGVIESLVARVQQYGSASVSDLYDYLGVTGSFTDQQWGWTNLDNADVTQTRRGFRLDLPRPISLSRR